MCFFFFTKNSGCFKDKHCVAFSLNRPQFSIETRKVDQYEDNQKCLHSELILRVSAFSFSTLFLYDIEKVYLIYFCQKN